MTSDLCLAQGSTREQPGLKNRTRKVLGLRRKDKDSEPA
ncbi:unnamed protein product [Tetraodon nigroviridis]|uniref:(spotted green pufferfish) hypothetical protein n=1 Tax=Tetraodon nigroviridis TaxID=99883 RepID=Q4SSN7_TETNG|nr:unnamed protein product [Tetraodon nigroviridis]